MKQILTLVLFSLFCICGPASAEQCKRLVVTISGDLPSVPVPASGVTEVSGVERPVIEVPLAGLGETDPRLAVRFSKAGDDSWVVHVFNGFSSDKVASDDFVGPLTRIEFDANGKQTTEQKFFAQPQSRNADVASSWVEVRFSSLSVVAGPANLHVRQNSATAAVCSPQGVIDVNNDANGGVTNAATRGLENVPEGFMYGMKTLSDGRIVPAGGK
jgi:hypothetical protein